MILKKLMNSWLCKKAKNFTEVPILWIALDMQRYEKSGARGCFLINCLPEIAHDKETVRRINDAVDYIRENFDMEKLMKF